MAIEDRNAALAELISICEPYAEPALGTQGAYQSEIAKVIGAIGASGAGNATVIVTAAAMANSPKTLQVPVANNDTAYQVATKIRAALVANVDVGGFFDISGSGVDVIVTAKGYADNDATMNLSIANGTCTGLTTSPTSTNRTEGANPDLTELEAILDNNLLATVWKANTVYKVGAHVYPTTRNGYKYVVVVEGTSGATEPEWPKSFTRLLHTVFGAVVNGTVTFDVDGVEFEVGYDIDAAAREAWDKKAAKASEFVSTPGVDMSKIFDRCEKMRDRFNTVQIA